MKVFVGPTACVVGRRFSKTQCPIALALQARGFQNVSVDLDLIRFGNHAVPTPQLVQDTLMANDEGRELVPFSFELPWDEK